MSSSPRAKTNNRRQNSSRTITRRIQQPTDRVLTTNDDNHTLFHRKGGGGQSVVSPAATAARLLSMTTYNNVDRSESESRYPSSNNKKLSKLLVNVTVEGSVGPVKLVVSPEKTVKELIKAVVEIYVKEKRRPFLKETNTISFQLHYSPFSLESLDGDKKLINLGSRNFFLWSKPSTTIVNSSCSQQEKIGNKFAFTKLIDFLLFYKIILN